MRAPRGHVAPVFSQWSLSVRTTAEPPLKFPYYEDAPRFGEIDGIRVGGGATTPRDAVLCGWADDDKGWAPLPHELLRCQAGSAVSGEKLLGRGAVRLPPSRLEAHRVAPYGDWTGFTWAAGPVRSWGAASQGPVRPVHARFPSPAGTLSFPLRIRMKGAEEKREQLHDGTCSTRISCSHRDKNRNRNRNPIRFLGGRTCDVMGSFERLVSLCGAPPRAREREH